MRDEDLQVAQSLAIVARREISLDRGELNPVGIRQTGRAWAGQAATRDRVSDQIGHREITGLKTERRIEACGWGGGEALEEHQRAARRGCPTRRLKDER